MSSNIGNFTCHDCHSNIFFDGKIVKYRKKVTGPRCKTCSDYISKLKIVK